MVNKFSHTHSADQHIKSIRKTLFGLKFKILLEYKGSEWQARGSNLTNGSEVFSMKFVLIFRSRKES